MKRKIFLFLLIICVTIPLSSCNNKSKNLKISESGDAFIRYDFKSFEYLEIGKEYQVEYHLLSSESMKSYVSPAKLFVYEAVNEVRNSIYFYIQYISPDGKMIVQNISQYVSLDLIEDNVNI